MALLETSFGEYHIKSLFNILSIQILAETLTSLSTRMTAYPHDKTEHN